MPPFQYRRNQSLSFNLRNLRASASYSDDHAKALIDKYAAQSQIERMKMSVAPTEVEEERLRNAGMHLGASSRRANPPLASSRRANLVKAGKAVTMSNKLFKSI
mgnify:CR=1 FL=1